MQIFGNNGNCQQNGCGHTDLVKMTEDISNICGLQELVDMLATFMVRNGVVVKMVVVVAWVVRMAHIADIGAFHQCGNIVVVMIVRNTGVYQDDGIDSEQ